MEDAGLVQQGASLTYRQALSRLTNVPSLWCAWVQYAFSFIFKLNFFGIAGKVEMLHNLPRFHATDTSNIKLEEVSFLN